MKENTMPRLGRVLSLLLVQTLCCASASAAESAGAHTEIVVFAAASLTEAVGEIARAYEETSGQRFKISFASSSTLARQIENGAAADIFLSADEEWMKYLDERKLVVASSRSRPIGNQLVLVAPADSSVSVRLVRGVDLLAALAGERLATGDPAHVPAGRYAQQALEYLGAWKAVEPRLARAENVRAALALVERGEAPLGIVYATDAHVAKAVRVVAEFPAESHEPIRYSFAILAGHDEAEVREAFAFLTAPAALDVFREQGFVLP
jgi:molybdate transport system substrate-binding protein